MGSKADIIQKWYEDIWIGGDLDKIEQMYQPAEEDECLIAGTMMSVEETKELVVVIANLVTDMRVRVIHTIEKGDWVCAMVEVYGFKSGTETPVYLRWLTMVRIDGERIVESYPSVNFLTFFEQLGQLPESAFELLLGGTVLR